MFVLYLTMLTYEYNIYDSERNKYLDQMLAEASFVWNHALALQKRYYALFGGYIDIVRLQKHYHYDKHIIMQSRRQSHIDFQSVNHSTSRFNFA